MKRDGEGSRRMVVGLLALGMIGALAVGAWALSDAPEVRPDAFAERSAQGVGTERGHRGHGWVGSGARARGWSASADGGVAVVDPQMAAFERSWQRFGDAGVGSAPGPEFSPTTHLGVLRAVEGSLPLAAGARCEVRLLPVLSSLFNCVIRVACDDVVLYPDSSQEAGYAPCSVSDGIAMSASDDGTTAQDGDPRLEVDVLGRRVHVSDEGPNSALRSAEIGLLRPI